MVELQLVSGCGGGWSVVSAPNGKGLVVDNVLHVLKAGMCRRASVKYEPKNFSGSCV
jgi:hypothetical protein